MRERLESTPPVRRTVGDSSKQRIRATLRTAINDLIRQQKTTFNPAQYLELPSGKTKPLVWTDERMEEWLRTGIRPAR